MAKIMPFKAMRYDLGKVADINNVITMPYDRIKHELQDTYYNRSEYNICRVIRGKEQDSDTQGSNVYTRAATYWNEWQQAGVVKEDPRPALYAYYQTFTVEGQEFTRRGMCCMVELEDYATGKVKAHERTLDAPKQDRFKLLTHTDTHFGQIFQLYPDDDNEVAKLIAQHTNDEPLIDAQIPEEDARHQLWAVDDPKTIAAVQKLMDDRLLFIADGHHRYETALNYRNHCLKGHKPDPEDGHSPYYAMMTLVGMSDPGLLVLPTLRIVHSLPNFDLDNLLVELARYFNVSQETDLDTVQRKLDAAAESKLHNAFGMYCDGKYWYFELEDRNIMGELAPDHTEDWRSLDVAVLHEVVLERILGIDKAAQAAKTNISYERDRPRAKSMVDDGSHQCLFYMNPTLMEQIRNVAGRGEVMPQKSTDFFPKLLSGLCACKVHKGQAK